MEDVNRMSKHIAVIDIGTTGVRILAAKINNTGIPHIIAKAQVSCDAISKYEIADESLLINSIKSLLNKVKERTGIIIKTAYLNIPADKIKFIDKSDSLVIANEEEALTSKHIVTLLEKTGSIDLYEDEIVVDIIPMRYFVDGLETKDVEGLFARKLSLDAKLVIAKKDYTDKLINCANLAGLAIDGFIPSSVSLGQLIPFKKDRDESVLLIDVGGQVTEYVLYYKSKVFTTGHFPVGGDNITRDLAKIFSVSIAEADSLKKDYPLATIEVLSNNIDVAIFSLEKASQEVIKVGKIVEVMEARINSILWILKEKLEGESIDSSLIDRVILTGDGLSKFKGMDLVCRDVLGTSLDSLDFSRLTGMDTKYTVAGGMVMYMASSLPLGRKESLVERIFIKEEPKLKKKKKSVFSDWLERIKEFFASFKE